METTVTGRDGGYYYGNQAKPKEFKLSCFFEKIPMHTYEAMMQWVGRDKEGRLIFDDRPFVYYTAISHKPPEGEVYRTRGIGGYVYSGKITLYFKAYDPYGKMMYAACGEEDPDGAMEHCGMLPVSMMPSSPLAHPGSYLVYNPGTEMTEVTIKIAGSAPNGLEIRNETTGDVCQMLGVVTDPNWIEINSDEGSIKIKPSTEDKFAFELHNLGYIRLAPCTPYLRNLSYEMESGSDEIVVYEPYLTQDMVGQYMYINGGWRRIIYVRDDSHAVLAYTPDVDLSGETVIVTMNVITLSGEDLALTKFEIFYEPKVR